MDSNRLDRLSKHMALGVSRRRLLRDLVRGAAGVAVAGGVAAVSGDGAGAKRRVEPPCTAWWCGLLGRCRGPRELCTRDDQCCSRRCRIVSVDPTFARCN
jgi:hypothetical protein